MSVRLAGSDTHPTLDAQTTSSPPLALSINFAAGGFFFVQSAGRNNVFLKRLPKNTRFASGDAFKHRVSGEESISP